jgi:uncharacterized membrane protein
MILNIAVNHPELGNFLPSLKVYKNMEIGQWIVATPYVNGIEWKWRYAWFTNWFDAYHYARGVVENTKRMYNV